MPPLASAPRPKPKRKVYLNHCGSARKQPRWINRRLTMKRSRRRRRRTRRRRRRRRLELQAKPDHCPLPMRICLNMLIIIALIHTQQPTPRHSHTHTHTLYLLRVRTTHLLIHQVLELTTFLNYSHAHVRSFVHLETSLTMQTKLIYVTIVYLTYIGQIVMR